ncbi:aspartic peptidase domain-containing protein [Suillus spraguei]|nr:aspartic peptidase domain-containing protein [Suillus spraguei]
MFSVASLLALLALSVTGSPFEVRNSPITLPMTRRPAFSNVTDLLRHDEALVAALTEHSTHDRLGIGNPTTTYELIVDSLCGITWVGARTPYPVRVDYGYGSFEGMAYNDIINSMTVGIPQLVIQEMTFGVASASQGFPYDGVLGIGPRAFIPGTLDSPDAALLSVTDYLYDQRYIRRYVVGIFFQPAIAGAVQYGDGEISFGAANRGRYNNRIRYIDITTNLRSSQITYGNMDILANTAGVVNCGCTFVYIASDAFERYKTATGGIPNAATGLLQISLVQYYDLRNLNFHIGGVPGLPLIPNAQIWPRSLNNRIDGGGGLDDIFLIVRRLEAPTGSGLDFINGYVFLQRYYTVFDSSGTSRVGFAHTPFTRSDIN